MKTARTKPKTAPKIHGTSGARWHRFTFVAPADLIEKLDLYCATHRMTRTLFLRGLIHDFLEENERSKKIAR